MKLSNLRVATRLLLAFGSISLLMLLVSVLSMFKIGNIKDDLDEVVNDKNVRVEHVNDMRDAVYQVDAYLRDMVLLTEASAIQERATRIERARAQYRKAYDALMAMPPSGPEIVALRQKLASSADAARTVNNQVSELAKQNQNQQALSLLMTQSVPMVQAWQDVLHEMLEFQKKANQAAYEAGAADARAATTALVVGNLLVVVLVIAVGTLVSRSITLQLGGEPHEASDIARAVARGDLSIQLRLQPGDETSMMAHFKVMLDSLSQVVSSIRGNAESLATVSEQISQGNNDLSARTEQQASSLEETAASMEELGSTARLNADSVREANQLAVSATSVAAKGGDVVTQVIDTMRGINESSSKISEIINVIDGIAFQTNILALNAAVEAARAGEQGRGFAVVASEVRSLAQRSAEAAREIKGLITSSVERVQEGSVLVDQAGQTIAEVVTSVKHVTELMNELNVAINEQSANVSQVSDAVNSMDKVTQQNAALVEESAAAAESLKDQAHQMFQTVSLFKLGTR